MKLSRWDAIIVIGFGSLLFGLWHVWFPLPFIVGGIAAVGIGALMDFRSKS